MIGSQIINSNRTAGVGRIKVKGESNIANILQIFCGSAFCKTIQSINLIGLPTNLTEGIVITGNLLVVTVKQSYPQSCLVVLVHIKLQGALCQVDGFGQDEGCRRPCSLIILNIEAVGILTVSAVEECGIELLVTHPISVDATFNKTCTMQKVAGSFRCIGRSFADNAEIINIDVLRITCVTGKIKLEVDQHNFIQIATICQKVFKYRCIDCNGLPAIGAVAVHPHGGFACYGFPVAVIEPQSNVLNRLAIGGLKLYIKR